MLNMLPFANSLVIAALQQTTLRVGATAVGLAVVLIGASNAYAVTVTEQFVSPTPAGTPYPRDKKNAAPKALDPPHARNRVPGANDERPRPPLPPPAGGPSRR